MAEQDQPQQTGAEPETLDDDPTTEGAPEPDEWEPPTREQYDALVAAHQAELEKAQGKLKRARGNAQRLREGGGRPAAAAEGEEGEPAVGPDPQLAVWQRRAVRTAAESALRDRGARPELARLALNELNAAEVEFNRQDEPELEEWLDEMEERYPALFAKQESAPVQQPGRQAMGGVDQGRAAAGGPAKPARYGDRVLAAAARAQGRRPR